MRQAEKEKKDRKGKINRRIKRLRKRGRWRIKRHRKTKGDGG